MTEEYLELLEEIEMGMIIDKDGHPHYFFLCKLKLWEDDE